MPLPRGNDVAAAARLHQRTHFRRQKIRHHTHHADRARRHEGQRQSIIAAQNRKRLRHPRRQIAHPLHAAARFLDRNDVAAVQRESLDDGRTNIHATAAGNVIEHDRQLGRLRDRLEMPEEAFLARLVVIWSDDECAIHAHLLRGHRGGDRFARGIRTGARQHLATAVRNRHCQANHLLALVVRQRRALAGCPDRDEAGNASRDLAFD